MYERIVDYLTEYLSISPGEISRDTTMKNLGLDSLDLVEIIQDMEEQLDVEFDFENMDVSTVGELADFFEEQIG